jgi:hypothetical protein
MFCMRTSYAVCRCADIVWTGTSIIVAGPDTQCILDRLPRGAVVVGVRFHPAAA